jgi:signal transduction histidine kinase
MKLQSFLELGKEITDSPLCEIDITDWKTQWIFAHKESDIQVASQGITIDDDTIRKNGSLEIEDLSKDSRYKKHPHVKGKPWLRHYFGVQLTTSEGKDIGTLSVTDTMVKRVAKEQKVQFKLLAHAIMMTIESENRHHNISSELDSLKKNLHRLNHDVRSPVNGITGLVDLMVEDKEEISIRTHDILMIKKSAQSIVEIITEVIAAVDQEKNKENWPEKNSLTHVIKKIEDLFNPLAQSKKITLSLTNSTEHKIGLPYDFSIKLLRIVSNLVSNAIKFSPEYRSVNVIFNVVNNNNLITLNITVENAGKSMSSEQIHSFTSGEVVARTNEHGEEESSGLGLQHVYQVVTEEGGSVAVEKGNISGTIFSITLPIPNDDIKIEKISIHDPFDSIDIAKPTVNGKH